MDSLLGRVKQPRGFGSQHLATVNVTGLQTDRPAIVTTGGRVPAAVVMAVIISVVLVVSVVSVVLVESDVSPWLVDNLSQDSNSVVVTHVLKVDVVNLRASKE